ncbi:MAG: hypothetical protein QXR58_01980 [Candidatus Micrarchaeaceae archaeon]
MKHENGRAKSLYALISRLETGICIVEGWHDVNTLSDIAANLGISISTITYDRFMSDGTSLKDYKKVFVLMDNDYGGRIKQNSILAKLASLDYSISIDTDTGKRILALLGVKCFEQLRKPVADALGANHSI